MNDEIASRLESGSHIGYISLGHYIAKRQILKDSSVEWIKLHLRECYRCKEKVLDYLETHELELKSSERHAQH